MSISNSFLVAIVYHKSSAHWNNC